MEFEFYVRARKEELESKYEAVVGREMETWGDDDKSIIPKNFALRHLQVRYAISNSVRYLRYVNDEKVDGFLEISGRKLLTPYTKFISEVSDSDPNLVHIRCSYNNRYWVRQSSDSQNIVATATEKEEDQSKWSCTLFQPIYDSDKKAYRFIHVQLGYELFNASISDDYPMGLVAKKGVLTRLDWENSVFFTVIDWGSLYMFPKYVTFKGSNGKYLRYIGKYLQFSGTSPNQPSVINEIFTEYDGTIRIKNMESNRFWIRDPNWIVATSGEGSRDDSNVLFQPVKLGHNIVALRNLGNNHFCTSLSADYKSNYLNADYSNPTKETRLEVAEAVISSTMENIEYHFADAKIYGERVWSMAKGDAVNKTKENDTVQFACSFEDKRKKNWTNAMSTNFGFTKQFTAGVPIIGDGKISLEVDVGRSYAWGETHKDKILMSCNSTITIPPMSKVKVDVIVKKGQCVIPFSYTKIDTLRDGRRVSHEYDDGVFSGINSYQFQLKTDKVALPV